MHPVDDLGHPLSLVMAVVVAATVLSLMVRVWKEERRYRREERSATRQAAALEALRRMRG